MQALSDSVFGSAQIQDLVNQLTQKVVSANKVITKSGPSDPSRKDDYATYIKSLNEVRGRNLYYPYVSSGLGRGPYVKLEDGSVKMDLINGIGVHLFGHSHPEIVKASILGSLQDVVMQGNLQPNTDYEKILKLLVKSAGRKSRIARGWITTCGTMANENALKIARQKTSPAKKILAFKDCFAGRSTLMAEITDNDGYRVGLPRYNEVLYLPFFDKKDPTSTEKTVSALKKHIAENKNDISCIVFEPIQGEGGFNVAPTSFLKAVLTECRNNKIAVWADEIQTFGRTGELFAFEKLDIGEFIDLVTLAKTAQCAATLYTEEFNPKPGLIAGTFTSSTVSISAGLRGLNMLINGHEGERYLGKGGKIDWIHTRFVEMLRKLASGPCKGLIGEIDGIGLMVSMVPYDGAKEKVDKLLQALYQNGLMAFSCGHGPYKLRFLIPVVLEQPHIDEASLILEKCLKECS